ncbi:MAG: T9SS type A sorting domain-containing protein [Bacteroidia bacterium]|nr:T9SS type A sorting domain-containing protein [Bacteroidia bacterium]
MLRIWTTLLLACGLWGTAFGQVVYEDFESGAMQTWNALNGTFDGVFANPDSSVANPSDSVGSYTKSNAHAFSLFLTELAAPMDLSVNNEFHIMINSPVATQILMKLEGPSGGIERLQNIAVTNAWIDYTFDFSGASGATDYNRIILFFDPGVTTSGDTYLFDNIIAYPAGPCAGTVPDVTIIDDFECQRNASYGGGYLRLERIANPDASGINTSANVGKYTDPEDQWSALAIDYNSPIDLSTLNTYKIKVWAPIAGDVLLKLEGGLSAPFEVFTPITVTNQWVEISVDCSSQAAANHKRLAIFMNAGVQAGANDVYYLDDITREETPSGMVLEDFDPTKMFWEPLGGNNAVHGTLTVVVNPNSNADNNSPNVGSYVKGSSSLSTLTGTLSAALDLSTETQINIQVFPPTGASSLTMQLSSPTQGNKEVNVSFAGSGAWETLSFDFANFNGITDFNGINLLFDPGAAGSGTYLFDNLVQTGSTVDPCAGTVLIPNFLDDFECQRQATYGAGANNLAAINNPDISPVNSSAKVGEYTDPLDQWSALVIDFGAPIDLSLYNQLLIKIWSPGLVPLKFKLEGGTSLPVEIDQTVTTANQWVQYAVDFSGQAGENHQKIVIFFNAGVQPSQQDIYYIDDIRLSRAPYTACVATFENPDFTLKGWRYFANGTLENTVFQVIENPDKTGINSSDSVGIFIESSDGLVFAGMYTDVEAPISLPNGNKTIRMKVWSDHAATMVMKLERPRNGAPGSGDISAEFTTPNQWQELTFDFSGIVPDDAFYDRITLILDIANVPAVTTEYYFDDIVIADGICGTTGLFDQPVITNLVVFPNPTTGTLRVESSANMTQLRLTSLMGQTVLVENLPRQSVTELDLSGLSAGVYFLSGFDGDRLVSRTKVIKE